MYDGVNPSANTGRGSVHSDLSLTDKDSKDIVAEAMAVTCSDISFIFE